MNLIAIIGTALALAVPHHHQPRYWWLPSSTCQVGTIQKNGIFRGVLGIVCTTDRGGWHNKPQPPYVT